MVLIGKDGGIQNFELHGLVTLRITDEKYAKIKIYLDNKDKRGIQLQVLFNFKNHNKLMAKMCSNILFLLLIFYNISFFLITILHKIK